MLVAHSCGSIAVAHWAARFETPIAGAFLVAPPDCQRTDPMEPIRRFGLPEVHPLPFPTVVVAGEDDPYCGFGQAATLARKWGAMLRSAGAIGQINTASGCGPWPEGRRLLDEFLAAIDQGPADAAEAGRQAAGQVRRLPREHG